MNPVMAVMRMHLRDKWNWFVLPWIIVMSSFLVNFVIALIAPIEDGLYTGGISSIFIYMFVVGIVAFVHTFPFALGFSVRRKDYYWGTAVTVFMVSIVMSLILVILSSLERVSGGWGTQLHFFHLPYLSDGGVFRRFWINFVLFIVLYYSGFTISSVHRRFGVAGTYSFLISTFLILSIGSFVCTYFAWWDDVFTWLASYSAFALANWALIPAAICLVLSYLFMRRSTV